MTDLGDASRDITGTLMYQEQVLLKAKELKKIDFVADIATGKMNENESIIHGITKDNTNGIQKVLSIYLCNYGFVYPHSPCLQSKSQLANTTRCLCMRGDIWS